MNPRDEIILHSTDFVDGPGTVVRDLETLLDFVGVEGLRVTGKNFFLPMARLRDLDERMTQPLRPTGARPQQAAFPHIHGLFLLFRATGLGVGMVAGKTGSRLGVDADQLAVWQTLNPTEKYMSLLETWWLHADGSILGEGRSWRDAPQVIAWAAMMVDVLRDHPNGVSFEEFQTRLSYSLALYSSKQLWRLALPDLFGMLEIERGEPNPPFHWSPRFLRPTAFGGALFRAVAHEINKNDPDGATTRAQEDFGPILGFAVENFVRGLNKSDDAERPIGQSGLQSVLGSYFPEWRRTFGPPVSEFREGTHCFRVSWGDVWRDIVIGCEHTLSDLAAEILDAYEFDHDHLYVFRLRDRRGAAMTIAHPAIDEEQYVSDDFAIGELPLNLGQSMIFYYDFGESWEFDVLLRRVAPEEGSPKKPKVVASRGAAPRQWQ